MTSIPSQQTANMTVFQTHNSGPKRIYLPYAWNLIFTSLKQNRKNYHTYDKTQEDAPG